MNTMQAKTLSNRHLGFIIGVSLILMAIASGIAFGGIHPSLFTRQLSSTAFGHIASSINMLRLEIVLWLIVIILDVIVAWALHMYMRQFHEALSLLTVWLRLIYTAILAISVTYLINIIGLINLHTADSSLSMEQLAVKVSEHQQSFALSWEFGLIIFGLHLLLLTYIILRATPMPKLIGYLLLIAALSYMVIHSFSILGSAFDPIVSRLESILTIPMALGELSVGLWLLVRAGKTSA